MFKEEPQTLQYEYRAVVPEDAQIAANYRDNLWCAICLDLQTQMKNTLEIELQSFDSSVEFHFQ